MQPAFFVRRSDIHGNGAFAARDLAAGAFVTEYEGERISAEEFTLRSLRNRDDPFHTFFFSLRDGGVIDGGSGGNDARWFNHSCAPNCEPREELGRVFLYTLRAVQRGEELNFDYRLDLGEPVTRAHRKAYACRCGSAQCRGTMLALEHCVEERVPRLAPDQSGLVAQQLDFSGGAAALATLLRLRMDMPITEGQVLDGLELVADAVKTARRGHYSFLDFKRFVQVLGLSGTGYCDLSLTQLCALHPCIVQTTLGVTKHTAVFRGLDGERVLLGDPLYGNVLADVAEFLASWPSQSAFVVGPPGVLAA